MSKRPPSSPPSIPGFEYIRLLGSGGFADVFLYQQQHPRRQVAVKVLLKERMAASTVASFTEEANLMAQLANPSIVAVYQTGVSSDSRPYLVMEFCSKPNLQARHRQERFSEAETLRIGIQIASAVETAHRAGILHRDIKPANILVTDYGRPTLTDFGISTIGTGAEAVGLSIPWSPPEVISDPNSSSPASDVYSLAATLYTLLTDRTPFQVIGAANGEIDLISRIQAMPVPAIGRGDVSSSLESTLARALSKDPAARPQSASEFARALQRIQIEHGMSMTPLDVVEEAFAAPPEDDPEEDSTRFSGLRRIDAQPVPTNPYAAPQIAPQTPLQAPLHTQTQTSAPTVSRPEAAASTAPSVGAPPIGQPGAIAPHRSPAAFPLPSAPPLDETVQRAPSAPELIEEPAAVRPRRRGLIAGIVAAVVLVAAAGTTALVMSMGDGAAPAAQSTPSSAPVDLDEGLPADVTGLAGEVRGTDVVFTWSNPDPQDGDSYRWRVVKAGESATFATVDEPTVTVPVDASGVTCLEVLLVRANGAAGADGVEECTP